MRSCAAKESAIQLYTQVSAGGFRTVPYGATVLLRSDGSVVVCGWNWWNKYKQCNIPPMEVTQVSAVCHTVVLSDGHVTWLSGHLGAVGDIPPIPPVLLRTGPRAPERFSYTQNSAGRCIIPCFSEVMATLLLGEVVIPADAAFCDWLARNMSYSQVSAGQNHTMLLRSDGNAVACGCNVFGQCNIPPLEEGIYMDLLRPDFCRWVSYSPAPKWWQCCCLRTESLWAMCDSRSEARKCLWQRHITWDRPCFATGRQICRQQCVHVDLQELRLKVRYSELAVEMQKRIATALKIGVVRLSKLPEGVARWPVVVVNLSQILHVWNIYLLFGWFSLW